MVKLAAQFVTLSPERRALAFSQTAARMSASPVMVEKDFWVCWLLGLLFGDAELAPHLVFKGGTSLSKVYGVIDRFSEDIDLSMSPAFLGADESVFDWMKSRSQRDAALAHMQARCSEQTRQVLMPRLEQAIVDHLGQQKAGTPWLRFEDDPVVRSPVVHFEYPTAAAPGFDYLRREVKLELGSLTDQRPTEQHPVRAWVVDDFPAAFVDWNCQVTALELQRTFWEKATILHAEIACAPIGAGHGGRPCNVRARRQVEGSCFRTAIGALRPGKTWHLPPDTCRWAGCGSGAGLRTDARHVHCAASGLLDRTRATCCG
jgi:Nucleotidyl transferase AbiEii toxin, Type IV TA system